MADWSGHGYNYTCNKFDSDGPDDQSEVAKARRELDRYLHYYKRYDAHAQAQVFAGKQLKATEERLDSAPKTTKDAKWSDVEYLKAANVQLVECRRVLKFTYVFGYYMTNTQAMQRERFEHHQEMLEKFTEKLSELSEKPVDEVDRVSVVNQVCFLQIVCFCVLFERAAVSYCCNLFALLDTCYRTIRHQYTPVC